MKKKICLTIDETILEKLKNAANKEHRTQSAIIEIALSDYFQKKEK